MLMSIVTCLQKNEPSTRVRMAAANALLNSVEVAWQGEFSDEVFFYVNLFALFT
jgi:hypothetical protein